MFLFPKRITRYVFFELVPPTMLGLFLYTFVLLMNHFFLVAEKALSKNLGADLTLRLFLVGIPELTVLSIPMSVLLGVMIAVGRLSADHEFIAMQATGLGPLRLLRPIVLFGALAALTGMLIYGYVVPRSNFEMRSMRGQILLASNLASDLKPRVFYTDLPGLVLFVDDIRTSAERRLRGVLLVMPRDNRRDQTEIWLAKSGDLYPAPDDRGTLILDLHDGVAHVFDDRDPETYRLFEFDFREMPIDAASHLSVFLSPPNKVVRDFNPSELYAEWKEARAQYERVVADAQAHGGNLRVNRIPVVETRVRSVEIEMHQRLALPMASFFFALLALPMGVTRVRSGKGAAFAMSILVILIYWATFTLARNQANAGNIPVPLGVWAGNLVLIPWIIIALWRLHRGYTGPGVFALLVNAISRRLPRLPGRALSAGGVDSPATALKQTGGARGRPATAATGGAAMAVHGPAEEDESPGMPVSEGSGRLIGRVDSYVLKSFLRILVFTVLSAYTIYALVEFKGLMDGVLRNQQPFSLVVSYFQFFAPGVLHIVLPISCLVGAVVTFSLLTRTGELTAIKSLGVSMRRVTVPVFAMTLVLCGVLFLVQDRIAPFSNRRAVEIKDRIEGRAPRSHGPPAAGQWGFGVDRNLLYHYRLYDSTSETFSELTALTIDRNKPSIVDHRFASKARYLDDAWQMDGGWYRSFPRNGDPAEYYRHDGTEEVDIPRPATFDQEVRLTSLNTMAQQMSVAELRDEIDTLGSSGYDITRLKVDYHRKWAHPLAPLVMIMLGLPFAFKVGRRGSLYGVGVALLLVLVYWATMATFNALGLQAVLDPIIAAWTPNILFGLVGLYLMLFIKT